MHVPSFVESEVIPGVVATYNSKSKAITVRRKSKYDTKETDTTFRTLLYASGTSDILRHAEFQERHHEWKKVHKECGQTHPSIQVKETELSPFHNLVACPSWITVNDNDEEYPTNDEEEPIDLSVFQDARPKEEEHGLRLAHALFSDLIHLENCENPIHSIQMATLILGLCQADSVRLTHVDLPEEEKFSEGISMWHTRGMGKPLIDELMLKPIEEIVIVLTEDGFAACYIKEKQTSRSNGGSEELDATDGGDGSITSEIFSILLEIGSSLASALAFILMKKLKRYLKNQQDKAIFMKGSDMIKAAKNSKRKHLDKGEDQGIEEPKDKVDGVSEIKTRKKRRFSVYMKTHGASSSSDEENK